MEDKVKAAIEDIRPDLQNDGGDIEFVKLEGNNVFVRLVILCWMPYVSDDFEERCRTLHSKCRRSKFDYQFGQQSVIRMFHVKQSAQIFG